MILSADHSNRIHKKLLKNKPILSPFGMWKFQLIKLKEEFDFTNLAKFKYQVSLELIGKGYYLSNNLNTSNLKLENFYEEISPLSLSNRATNDQTSNGQTRYLSTPKLNNLFPISILLCLIIFTLLISTNYFYSLIFL